MKFLTACTEITNTPISINTEEIVFFQKEAPSSTRIKLSTGETVVIEKSYEEVCKAIRALDKEGEKA